MIEPLNISIVGGGVGGLATAIALLKRGFNVQVYERAQALHCVDAGLTLTPNGLNSLDAIHPSILESLKQAGSELRTLTLKRSTGETIASKPILVMQRYGQPILSIQQSKLQAIFAASLPPDTIHFQHRAIGFEQFDNGVRLFFPGGKVVETDLLIGADGINSIVRQTLIGDGFPNYVDRVSWQAIVQFNHKHLSPNTSTLFTAADSQNFLMVDVGEGFTYWSASIQSTDDFVRQRSTSPKTRVLERFAAWAEPISEIVAATPNTAIVECPICDRPPLQSWSQGRVTLLGNAAHPIVPSLGQGVNIAFEDAYELAVSLSTASDIETALKAYESSRILRAAIIYDWSTTANYHSYPSKDEETLHGIATPMNQDEFEAWLYCYNVYHLTGGQA